MMSKPAVHKVTAPPNSKTLRLTSPRKAIQAAMGDIPRQDPKTTWESNGEALGVGISDQDGERQR